MCGVHVMCAMRRTGCVLVCVWCAHGFRVWLYVCSACAPVCCDHVPSSGRTFVLLWPSDLPPTFQAASGKLVLGAFPFPAYSAGAAPSDQRGNSGEAPSPRPPSVLFRGLASRVALWLCPGATLRTACGWAGLGGCGLCKCAHGATAVFWGHGFLGLLCPGRRA